MNTEGDWADEAEKRLLDLISELAREGKLNRNGLKGLANHATVIVEIQTTDGDDWWTVLQFPEDQFRDLLVHQHLIKRTIQSSTPEPDEENP